MILIISKNINTATEVSDILYFMEIISYPATPESAVVEFSEKYSSVLILSPNSLSDEMELLEILRAYSETVFIFAQGESSAAHLYDALFPLDTPTSKIVDGMKKHIQSALQNTCKSSEKPLFSTPNTLVGNFYTRSEKMIIKLLSENAPTAFKKEEILKYAFRKGRAPDVSSIRTHISIINKKSMKISGRKLIELSDGGGYTTVFQ